MGLNDLEIGKHSINLHSALKEFYAREENKKLFSMYEDIDMDRYFSDLLLTINPESLANKAPSDFFEQTLDDQHKIIERTLSALLPGDGLVFNDHDNNEVPLWLRVSIVEEGRTPLKQAGGYRWIRLTSIDQVVPKVALGGGNDSRGYGWNLQVVTNTGDKFYASDRTYRGGLIQLPVYVLMGAIDAAVKAANQPVAPGALSKPA